MTHNQATQKIWITGASTGIGAAVARRLLEQDNEVLVTARSLANLQPLLKDFPNNCTALALDLADPESIAIGEEGLSKFSQYLDVVIINAGTCEYVDVDNFSPEPFSAVLGINVDGAVNTLHIALPLLRRSPNRPYIVGVSSMAKLLPMPRSEAYGASKAALEYLLNSLRVDLTESFDVSVVRPGFVKTPLTDRNDFPMPFLITTEQAAEYILKGMQARKWIIQFPWQLVSVMSLCSWLPLRWQTSLLKKMSRSGK